MNIDTKPIRGKHHALAKVLLNYAVSPNRYALNAGQPVRVFQHLDTVIAWAQGKLHAELALQSAELQAAAIFFVRNACLRQGNTHYGVLGLSKDFSLEALRIRYRSLISLTHPDKGVSGLPQNSAMRINLAYETLCDKDKRILYDATLPHYPVVKPYRKHAPQSKYRTRKPLAAHRLQHKFPNLKNIVLFALPAIVVILIAVIVLDSQNHADLQLVEKASSQKQASSATQSVRTGSTNVKQTETETPTSTPQSDAITQSRETAKQAPTTKKESDGTIAQGTHFEARQAHSISLKASGTLSDLSMATQIKPPIDSQQRPPNANDK